MFRTFSAAAAYPDSPSLADPGEIVQVRDGLVFCHSLLSVRFRQGRGRIRINHVSLCCPVSSRLFHGYRPEQISAPLYERVGRYDGISAIADEYLRGIRSDPQFARFSGRSADSLRRAKQLLKDQLCALTGGPCTYIGRDMKMAHSGLGIDAEEWAVNMKYMAAALDKAKIAGKEKAEFLAIVDALKPEIAEKAK